MWQLHVKSGHTFFQNKDALEVECISRTFEALKIRIEYVIFWTFEYHLLSSEEKSDGPIFILLHFVPLPHEPSNNDQIKNSFHWFQA